MSETEKDAEIARLHECIESMRRSANLAEGKARPGGAAYAALTYIRGVAEALGQNGRRHRLCVDKAALKAAR